MGGRLLPSSLDTQAKVRNHRVAANWPQSHMDSETTNHVNCGEMFCMSCRPYIRIQSSGTLSYLYVNLKEMAPPWEKDAGTQFRWVPSRKNNSSGLRWSHFDPGSPWITVSMWNNLEFSYWGLPLKKHTTPAVNTPNQPPLWAEAFEYQIIWMPLE